ncbi:two-component sensor histidine kinase BarA [Colwellia sp. 4_MG-2023]|jgi:two-component system sensor histidine kinase BarA|uniref:two-component sensor histidine kinase BarA n=1 Tax=unclassified Colwellia TaxID=196834 RepID=UPI0026E1FCED|nr:MULTISPECIES: two-component sensor histidine kinase BarA [unclassified Colwellia]MDO6506700.1 two-component sensor histidine kinase BarA [Colwellia sp. 5_MG-2023]MDO6555526.1 two-component sensor histidine kinase BarA [Colwellia sp. 4_MG-2023]
MHKLRLKDWVILLTIVPIAFISFGLASYFSYNRSSELNEFLTLRSQSIIEPLAITTKEAYVNNNREKIRAIISAVHRSQSSLIKSITVFTLDNQILVTSAYHGDTNLMRLKPEEAPPSYTQGEHFDDFIIFRTPILDEKFDSNNVLTPLGYIAIHVDKSWIKLKQQSQYIIAFSLAFLAVLLSSLLALKLIQNVTKPINSMVNAIDRIREGKLESRVTGQLLIGELNFLKLGINAMAQSLGNYQNEMQSSIDQATIDLRESLEQYEIQNVELSIAKKKSQDANKIKSEFLANMSHELRTPLNGVIGFTRQVLKTPLSDSQRDYLQTIDRSANNLLAIINDILDFSKLEAGKMVIESIPFSLRESIDESLVLLAPSAHKKELELSIKIDNSLPDSLLGDAMRIKQIMSNLVSNAIKFTQHGSVLIDVTFNIINAKRAAIKITVADSGIGMSNVQQKTIFKAFTQADQSITRLHGGTGLGLVICQRLAHEMKGDIGFSSNKNHGSTFWFNFECGMNTLPVTGELEHLRLADKSILYYEPHSHSRAATYDILSNWDMKVTKVDTKTQLDEVLEQSAQDENTHFDFALIGHDKTSTALSDLKKTITKIKPQIANIHLAINSNSPSLHDALLASGALSCLSKPITTNKLYSALLAEPEYLSTPNKNILPIKVLAVDDNEANLKLINALLCEQVGEVVLADNGLKALELCQNEIFTLIFMDIQMPIMDGISSLQAIRRNSYNEKTPIIAVTAHALSGEKERMEQQGFDAYMTKPIDETMLKHIIYEYCDINYFLDSDKKNSHTPRETLPLTLQEEHNIKIIDWQIALNRTGGKENLAKEMLIGLIEYLPESKREISIALEEQDSTKLTKLIHKLNGTCCYTGVPQLTNICQEIETQLKKEAALGSLEPEFLEFFEQIELILEQAPSVLIKLNSDVPGINI